MTKKQRLSLILNLIDEFEISTQEELTEKLNQNGANVSQATVSRDINELALLKTEGTRKKIKYAKPVTAFKDIPQNFIDLIKQVTVSFTSANNLVVLKTLSGNANSVAMIIDKLHLPEIIGTIAGDDTLLIITKNNSDAERVVKSIKSF